MDSLGLLSVYGFGAVDGLLKMSYRHIQMLFNTTKSEAVKGLLEKKFNGNRQQQPAE